jgi:hypothetical protein
MQLIALKNIDGLGAIPSVTHRKTIPGPTSAAVANGSGHLQHETC